MQAATGSPAFVKVAEGIARLGVVFVNVYMLRDAHGNCILVDTGLPHTAPLTVRAVEAWADAAARPEAIVLTHGHFDHAGSAFQLAETWDLPIYAHPAELPFLTGRSDYPPQDPTMGGAIAFMARFFPHAGYDFGHRVRPLPSDGTVPGVDGWEWMHTPGHTPGHVSLFRPSDRVLLAGDALATMDLDSWTEQVARTPRLCRPPAPFTPDWPSTLRSIERLAELRPSLIAAGHGLPLRGSRTAEALSRLPGRIDIPPPSSRYVPDAAAYDEHGVASVPPPVPDPLTRRLSVGAAGAIAGAGITALALRWMHRRDGIDGR